MLICKKATIEDLRKFWADYHDPTKARAEALVGKRKDVVEVVKDLANLASNRAAAMWCRQEEDTLGAKVYDIICKQIATKLPPDVLVNFHCWF
jgi:hypothetical protein